MQETDANHLDPEYRQLLMMNAHLRRSIQTQKNDIDCQRESKNSTGKVESPNLMDKDIFTLFLIFRKFLKSKKRNNFSRSKPKMKR